VEEIIKEVQAEFADNEKLARRVSIYLCHKHSGLKLGEIGESFNVRDTAISEASRRFAKELETDGKLREAVARIKDRLKMCGM
jgi:chromosomal replication initiation ATPase DnaA